MEMARAVGEAKKRRTRTDVYWWYIARDYDPMYATWKADEWERTQSDGKPVVSGKRKTIKRGGQMSEWISMKEQLPSEPGEYFVLLSNPFRKPEQFISIDIWDGKDWADYPMSRDYMRWTRASHWMPVSELPKEDR